VLAEVGARFAGEAIAHSLTVPVGTSDIATDFAQR
jgi:hypothetical protein